MMMIAQFSTLVVLFVLKEPKDSKSIKAKTGGIGLIAHHINYTPRNIQTHAYAPKTYLKFGALCIIIYIDSENPMVEKPKKLTIFIRYKSMSHTPLIVSWV